ncbi:MAG: glycosyltransferase family 2 protein [Calditrichaeota bacterium]|nr:MAG: glycosyltransferase family 2 protein [Calditrichota bacterium]
MSRPAAPVSVVIPTRNRPGEVARLLERLAGQTYRPAEILIVDASQPPLDVHRVQPLCAPIPLQVIGCRPHLCVQKNLGLQKAAQPFVWLCDDDMDPPAAYLERLWRYLQAHPEVPAASGLVLEPAGEGRFQSQFPDTLPALLWKFCFQLSVWGPLPRPRRKAARVLWAPIVRWYRRRGNSWTLAGWPLITRWDEPVVHTAFYGLGACMVRRQALPEDPFPAWLDPYGIGDNYGLALNLPFPPGIAVLTDLPILHRKSQENRLGEGEKFARRLQALVRFVREGDRFARLNRIWLGWSLVGLWLQARRSGNRGQQKAIRTAFRALFLPPPGDDATARSTEG